MSAEPDAELGIGVEEIKVSAVLPGSEQLRQWYSQETQGYLEKEQAWGSKQYDREFLIC